MAMYRYEGNSLQEYLPQKPGKRVKNEKVMAYFYLSPRKFCHYDFLVPGSCYSSFVLFQRSLSFLNIMLSSLNL